MIDQQLYVQPDNYFYKPIWEIFIFCWFPWILLKSFWRLKVVIPFDILNLRNIFAFWSINNIKPLFAILLNS